MKTILGQVNRIIIPDLNIPDLASFAHTPTDKANALNTFFCQQTVLPGADSTQPDSSALTMNSKSFTSLQTTPAEVYDRLTHLKEGKAPGLDSFPPPPMPMCMRHLTEPICLFNRSFSKG